LCLLACLSLLGSTGCSLMLDFAECDDSAACYRSRGPQYRCSDEGYCVYQPLTAPELGCTLAEGMTLGEDTLVVASLLAGVSTDKRAERERSAALAFEQINQAGGLGGREFALLQCRDLDPEADDGEPTLAAARHIAASGRVGAVLGAASSQLTMDVFQEVLQGAGILMMSPSASSAAISFLDDDDLLWRVVPSDRLQGTAMAGAALAWAPPKVAFVAREDAYGEGLRETFNRTYCGDDRCSAGSYLSGTLPDSDDTTQMATLAQALAEFSPDLVVVAGFIDAVALLVSAGEAAGCNPTWLLTDGAYSGTLPERLPRAAWARIRGTRASLEPGPAYNGYVQAYRARFDADPTDAYGAHAYDAAFLVALAVAAEGAQAATSGAAVAKGLARLSSGPDVDVGLTSWGQAVTLLGESSDATVNVQGASGALDLNEAGEPAAAVEGWLIDEDGGLSSVGEVLGENGAWLGNPAFTPGT